jgi:hypothetical protein
MMNAAYKHLDSRLRIAELTIGQWVGVFLGVAVAALYGFVVHPFGTMVTVASAVYIGGLPAAAAMLAGFSDFDLWLVLRSAWRWRRSDGRYLPGAGTPTAGYRLQEADAGGRASHDHVAIDLAALWGEL